MQAATMSATDRILEQITKANATAPELAKSLGIPLGTATSRTSTLAKRGVIGVIGRRDGSKAYALMVASGLPQPQKTTLRNHFVLVLDHSGSMGEYGKNLKARDLVNAQLKTIRGSDQENFISYFGFGFSNPTVQCRSTRKSVKDFYDLVVYPTESNTPLRDGVIEACQDAADHSDDETSFVVMVFTDGQENSSSRSRSEFVSLIKSLQDTGRWTFVFMVPKGAKTHLVEEGVPKGNIQEWDSARGSDLREVEVKTCGGTAEFLQQRKQGKRQTKHYFAANLKDAGPQLHLLRDVTGEVDAWTVQKEESIEDFLGARRGVYVPGTGFYEVMKKEKRVEDGKKILLFDRQDGKVYADGTKSVRALAGFPEKGEIAVQPGNHGDFILLIQSKSSTADTFKARILPRGTRVAYWPNAV